MYHYGTVKDLLRRRASLLLAAQCYNERMSDSAFDSSPESGAKTAMSSATTALDIFLQCRRQLVAIAYRMLGSMADAEDILQEAFIRWQRGFQDDIQSPRAFLVTMVTRLCINQLQSARVKREQYFGQWLPEPIVTEDFSDEAEKDRSISLAFLLLLERLNPVQRAVFLLREVFDYEYSEIADIVGENETNCRQIFRRARQHVRDDRRRFETTPKDQERLLKAFSNAMNQGDMKGLLALFSQDITLYADGGGKVVAAPAPILGAEHVARFLIEANRKFRPGGVITRVAEINGQLGSISYVDGKANTVLAFDITPDGRIHDLYIVRNPDKLERLPKLSDAASTAS